VQVLRRVEGQVIAYEAVQVQIADAWRAPRGSGRAPVPAPPGGRADIEGIELEGAASPLVQ
jgi:peptidyl-prolyl cis-trans isomerase C